MKTLKVTFFLAALVGAMQLNAQSYIQINSQSSIHSDQSSIQSIEATVDYDNAQRPCIQVNLDPEPKTLKNAWREYLKDNYDFKLKGIGFLSNNDLLSAEAITVKQISSKEMDFYTLITEDENGSEMKVFVRYGYDIYLTKKNNPNEYEAITEIMDSFLKYYLPIYYVGRVNDTEKRIEKLTDETNELTEEIVDDSARIAELKKEIEELEEESESKNEMLAMANIKLIKRNEKLVRIKNQLTKL